MSTAMLQAALSSPSTCSDDPIRWLPNAKIIGPAFYSWLEAKREAEGVKPTADNTILRVSDAYKCSRSIALDALGYTCEKLDGRTLFIFAFGTFVHEELQAFMADTDPTARAEVPVSYRDWNVSLSGSADQVYGETVVGEYKTMGFGYEYAVGIRESRKGAGPKMAHLMQATLYAMSDQIDADRVHIVYVSKTTGDISEWLIGLDEHNPYLGDKTLRELASDELERLGGILKLIEAGTLPARWTPAHGRVESPARTKRVGSDDACQYCPHFERCVTLPTGRVSLAVVDNPPDPGARCE